MSENKAKPNERSSFVKENFEKNLQINEKPLDRNEEEEMQVLLKVQDATKNLFGVEDESFGCSAFVSIESDTKKDDRLQVEELEKDFAKLCSPAQNRIKYLAVKMFRYEDVHENDDGRTIIEHQSRNHADSEILLDKPLEIEEQNEIITKFYYHQLRQELNELHFPLVYLEEMVYDFRQGPDLKLLVKEIVAMKRTVDVTLWQRQLKYFLTILSLLLSLGYIFVIAEMSRFYYMYKGTLWCSFCLLSIIVPAVGVSIFNMLLHYDENAYEDGENSKSGGKWKKLSHRVLLSVPFLTTLLRDISILFKGFPKQCPPKKYAYCQESRFIWQCTQVERIDAQALRSIEIFLMGICGVFLWFACQRKMLEDTMVMVTTAAKSANTSIEDFQSSFHYFKIWEKNIKLKMWTTFVIYSSWSLIFYYCHQFLSKSKSKYYKRQSSNKDFLVILSILFFALDWYSDIVLAIQYGFCGETEICVLTLTFIAIPAVLSAFLSKRMFDQEDKLNQDGRDQDGKRPTVKRSIYRWTVSILQLGPILRNLKTLRYGVGETIRYYVPRNAKYYQKGRTNNADILFLRMVERYLEAAPQLMLQVYFYYKVYFRVLPSIAEWKPRKTNTAFTEKPIWAESKHCYLGKSEPILLLVAIATSVLSLAKVFTTLNHTGVINKTKSLQTEYDTSLSKSRKRANWETFYLYTFGILANLCVIVFRMNTLVIMAANSSTYFLVAFFALHWAIQLVYNNYVDYRTLKVEGKSYFKYFNLVDCVVAGAQIFAFVNRCNGTFNERQTMWRRLFQYLIFFIEDNAMIMFVFNYAGLEPSNFIEFSGFKQKFGIHAVTYFILMHGIFFFGVIILIIPPCFRPSKNSKGNELNSNIAEST